MAPVHDKCLVRMEKALNLSMYVQEKTWCISRACIICNFRQALEVLKVSLEDRRDYYPCIFMSTKQTVFRGASQ
jgi:hypothetical protein